MERHDKDNFTPLLIAACQGHADTIKTLLKRGARMSATDKNEKSAIYWAAEEDNLEALQVLITVSVTRWLFRYLLLFLSPGVQWTLVFLFLSICVCVCLFQQDQNFLFK